MMNEASQQFRFVLEKIVIDDSYSFLGLANIVFQQALS
jgi:hypothetical protein